MSFHQIDDSCMNVNHLLIYDRKQLFSRVLKSWQMLALTLHRTKKIQTENKNQVCPEEMVNKGVCGVSNRDKITYLLPSYTAAACTISMLMMCFGDVNLSSTYEQYTFYDSVQ